VRSKTKKYGKIGIPVVLKAHSLSENNLGNSWLAG
jgi:hypothetical protein